MTAHTSEFPPLRRIVTKYVEIPYEKIIEERTEVPVEKKIEKEEEQLIEKYVEREVIKEIVKEVTVEVPQEVCCCSLCTPTPMRDVCAHIQRKLSTDHHESCVGLQFSVVVSPFCPAS